MKRKEEREREGEESKLSEAAGKPDDVFLILSISLRSELSSADISTSNGSLRAVLSPAYVSPHFLVRICVLFGLNVVVVSVSDLSR